MINDHGRRWKDNSERELKLLPNWFCLWPRNKMSMTILLVSPLFPVYFLTNFAYGLRLRNKFCSLPLYFPSPPPTTCLNVYDNFPNITHMSCATKSLYISCRCVVEDLVQGSSTSNPWLLPQCFPLPPPPSTLPSSPATLRAATEEELLSLVGHPFTLTPNVGIS